MSNDKPKRKYTKSDIPTLNELTDLELSEPDVNFAVSAKQCEIWYDNIMRKVRRLFNRQSKYMTDNNETTDGLLIFLDKYPEWFANEYGEINRDMIKWALAENIKKNRAMIDKIQAIEKALNLEIHHTW